VDDPAGHPDDEGTMDDARWEPGMPVLDRQETRVPIPDRIPETAPTPLQKQYINLSAIALIAGALTITALNAGIPMTSPLVKLFVLIGAPILVITTADAALRFWRSAKAWMAVDRGRAMFRLVWAAAALLGIGIVIGVASVILLA
jgi:hypothetical protein